MKVRSYFAAAAVPVLALGTVLAAGGTAYAAPLAYTDTSVTASHFSTDQITGLTALFDGSQALGATPYAAPAAANSTLVFTATGTNLGTLNWSASPASLGDYKLVFTASGGTATLRAVPAAAVGATAPTLPFSFTVTVTDGKATATATVHAAADAEVSGDVDLTAAIDTVAIGNGANDNTHGTVDFTTAPAGVGTTLGNAPPGVSLSGGVLSASTAVPGTYSGVTVTAKDAGGAQAVETFDITVHGSVTRTPPPPPRPRPHLYHGHIITISNTRVEVGWNFGPGVTCALTRTFGYNMTDSSGHPHYGFTCYNPAYNAPGTDVGYWSGLAAGHTYDIQLIPAGLNRRPLPGAVTGWINLVTTR